MKRKKIVLFVFLIVGILGLFLTYKFKQNSLSKNKPVKEEKLSIMIKDLVLQNIQNQVQKIFQKVIIH